MLRNIKGWLKLAVSDVWGSGAGRQGRGWHGDRVFWDNRVVCLSVIWLRELVWTPAGCEDLGEDLVSDLRLFLLILMSLGSAPVKDLNLNPAQGSVSQQQQQQQLVVETCLCIVSV